MADAGASETICGGEPVISVSHLTKDYGHGRGIFDVSLGVRHGECVGFLGPNGAGKTTTIRHLMGFSRPQEGAAEILGLSSWENAARLQRRVGYLPGEIALPEGMTGVHFLNQMREMRGGVDETWLRGLLERFELDPSGDTKRMSLGVKRKLAVVAAFMHDPDILILDEPTSGLDPLMQERFIEFVREEKERGKTILLSSHIFREVDETCDRIAIIRDGKIVSDFDRDELSAYGTRTFRITFADDASFDGFQHMGFTVAQADPGKRRVRIHVGDADASRLANALVQLDVCGFREIPFTLEDYFMRFYKEDRAFEGVDA